MNEIKVKGARMHNLKNVSIDIPKDKIVVITGVSGSGKSSLAFDTIFAEGQRRYLESLSPYARQFLDIMDKPDVDSIEGLSPAIAIEQRVSSKNPRSTVGTVTEIYDYLRLLFARAGTPYCPKCGKQIISQTISQMVDNILSLPKDEKIILLSPIASGRKGTFAKEFEEFAKKGFVRAIVDEKQIELGDPPNLDKNKKHDIDIIIDKLEASKNNKERLADSIQTAILASKGIVKVRREKSDSKFPKEFLLSSKQSCADCNIGLPELTPQLFSFNSPKGACEACEGIGTKSFFDPDLVIPNKHLSLRENAIEPWANKQPTDMIPLYIALGKKFSFDINTPFIDLSESTQHALLYGTCETIEVKPMSRGKSFKIQFDGVINDLAKKFAEEIDVIQKEKFYKFMNERPCQTCNNKRLKQESLSVKIGDLNISELSALPVSKTLEFFENLKLEKRQEAIAKRIIKEINERLRFLTDVGLGYLTLDRATGTLAGGEDQRIRLATQLGTALTGVLYVLDEPSIGLHPRDNNRLLNTLKKLRDLENTVLVVEHDRDTMFVADYIIDLGPGAGKHGGEIIATGTVQEIKANPNSITGRYLSNKSKIFAPSQRRTMPDKFVRIDSATEHNLKNVSVDIPLGLFTCVTGVSGSGKSTLIHDTLYRGLMQRLHKSKFSAGHCRDITGTELIDKIINIDQSPIGRTPRSNPATYSGALTPIRELYSQLPMSKARGYKLGRFSFNVDGGRCEACNGEGYIKVEMQFLPDVFVLCEVCEGKRYNRETLEVTFKGMNIADVLSMTTEKAHSFFSSVPDIKRPLETMINVGLGYLELGQSATTLSGGEAQRLKLSKELAKRDTGRTLYILDEPTTGLHFHDTRILIDVLYQLVDRGNTIIVIEHNLDLVKCADYVIDMGPEGGDAGGEIVALGTPEEIASNKKSSTGKYLKELL